MTVRERILRIMQEKNINKAELARRMGEGRHFTQKRLSPTPDNKASIEADEVPRFARALGVSVQDLYAEGAPPPIEAPVAVVLSMQSVEQIGDELQERLERTLSDLLSGDAHHAARTAPGTPPQPQPGTTSHRRPGNAAWRV